MPVSLNWATPSASTTYITNENKGKIDTLSAARTRRLLLRRHNPEERMTEICCVSGREGGGAVYVYWKIGIRVGVIFAGISQI